MSEELRTLQAATDVAGIAATEKPPVMVVHEWVHPLARNCNVVTSQGHTARWIVPNDQGSPESFNVAALTEGSSTHGADKTTYMTGNAVTAAHANFAASSIVSDEFRRDLANDAYPESQTRDICRSQVARTIQQAIDGNATSVNVGAVATKQSLGTAMSKLMSAAWNERTAFYVDAFTWSETLCALGAEVNTDITMRANGLLGYYAGYPVWIVHHYSPAPSKMAYFGDLHQSIGLSLSGERSQWYERPATDSWQFTHIISAAVAWIGDRQFSTNMPSGTNKAMVKFNFA